MNDLTFSVIICAYTEARWNELVAAVASVQRQTLPPHDLLVVVDHNPLLLQRAGAEFPGVSVIENRGAPGLSAARNSGLAAAQGSVIVFLDDDACAAPDWLARLSACYADPAVIGVGGAIQPRWVAGRPVWFPAEFHWVVGCTYRGMPKARAAVRNLIGCNMSFRRAAFDLAGGFRIGRVGALSIGLENDDTEFCIRLGAAQSAMHMIYEPAAVVQHAVPAQRATPGYFVRRCYSEGISKARLARLVGRERGLASERAYTLQTLPAGVGRGIADTLLRRDLSGVLRAFTIMAGLTITTAGYAVGLIIEQTRRRSPARLPSEISGVEQQV